MIEAREVMKNAIDIMNDYQSIPEPIVVGYPDVAKIFLDELAELLEAPKVSRATTPQVTDKQIIDFIAVTPATILEISDYFGREVGGMKSRIQKLWNYKKINRCGHGKPGSPFFYKCMEV